MKRLTHEEFMMFSDGFNKNLKIVGKYEKSDVKIECVCMLCGKTIHMTPDNLKAGKGCGDCFHKRSGKERTKKHEDFVAEMNHVNSSIKIIGKYSGAHKKIECKCLVHNTLFYSTPTHLLNGKVGCRECSGHKIGDKLRKNHDEFVLQLKAVHPNIACVSEYQRAKDTIRVRCNECNYEWEPIAGALLCGFGCPYCNRSSNEKEIDCILRKNGIRFVPQKTFDNLTGLRNIRLSYDFYLIDYDLLIEFQGRFHDGSTNFSDVLDWLPRRKQLDRIKREYANENGHNYLEIWYYEFNDAEKIILQKINDLKDPATTTVA